MNAVVDRLLESLITAIDRQIDDRRGLLDPLSRGPTPADHYGNTAAALALTARSAFRWPRAQQALQAWENTDRARLGHLPFNRLLLVLLGEVLKQHGAPAGDIDRVRSAVRRCVLRNDYPSNNWTLLAQTCRLIEAPTARRAPECRALCQMFERWTTSAGGFIDFPARPVDRISTPLAYHHKALFLAALACHFHEDPELARHAQRLLDWLVHCWDPAGYAGGLGRSNHALFGDACLLSAMILLGLQEPSAQAALETLTTRIAGQRRTDGLLWLTPSGRLSGRTSWDSYMHLSVYNAWAAALVAVSLHLRRDKPTAMRFHWHASATGCFHDAEAGILYWRSPGGHNALLTTRGQAPQSFSRHEADFRYAGGIPMHVTRGDGSPLISPPVRAKREELERHPALAGWTPLLRIADELYALTDFDRVSVTPLDCGVRIDLEGFPRQIFRPPARSLFDKAVSAIDWRLLSGRLGRHTSLKRKACSDVRAALSLCLTETPDLSVSVTLGLTLESGLKAYYLNPAGHSWAGSGPPLPDEIPAIELASSLPHAWSHAARPLELRPGSCSWSFAVVFDAHGNKKLNVMQPDEAAPDVMESPHVCSDHSLLPAPAGDPRPHA